jgi:hypothetical protein
MLNSSFLSYIVYFISYASFFYSFLCFTLEFIEILHLVVSVFSQAFISGVLIILECIMYFLVNHVL